MWFFAILVVVVMGGVAALAAGRGAPMSDAYDDRPDSLVPREGALRAEHIRRVRFSLAFRGYRMSEVDALLDRVARQLDDGPRPPEDSAEPRTPGQDEVVDTPADREARGDGPPG
ncbi:DivIVA domain-containing protein [Nocardioides halotolerans]|jgi:DivIVA domain-containing protein|uniref:DivIVA domain-containing protein n=1 Tax=Nocardioides halotolerans TaxID=433660 RepID=UPI00068722A1|nr:DivIVA domain-containing protein [Nocardioides halotolerans]